jgi:hypothetical protein
MVIDAERYPRTAAAFAAMHADAHIARIAHLDTVWHHIRMAVAPPTGMVIWSMPVVDLDSSTLW